MMLNHRWGNTLSDIRNRREAIGLSQHQAAKYIGRMRQSSWLRIEQGNPLSVVYPDILARLYAAEMVYNGSTDEIYTSALSLELIEILGK